MPHADPEVRRAYRKRYAREHSVEAVARARAWKEANPERVAANHAAWAEKNRDKLRNYQRAWYLQNRERILERVRGQYQRELEKDAEARRKRGRDSAARRRVHLRAVTAEHIDLDRVWERDKGICGICGLAADPEKWHLDHKVAIARGGEHSYANVQVSHPQCNWQKAAS